MYKAFIVMNGVAEEILLTERITSENCAENLSETFSKVISGSFALKNGSFIAIPEAKMHDVYFMVVKEN